MLGGWSSTVDPIQLADTGARLTGELPLKGMSRLVEACSDDVGSVRIDLQFERTRSDGLRTMSGTIAAQVHLTCQRCMAGMSFELEARPRLLLLRPGEHEDLLETGDAIVVEHPVPLSALVEEELLLQMPMVPLHPADRCPIETKSGAVQKKEEARSNPFAVLEKLKRTDA